MPLDSRILNGRVVTPQGVTAAHLTVDGGQIIVAPDDAEVWREIDASGYFVLPGLIQSAAHDGRSALDQVSAGITTEIRAITPDDPTTDLPDALDRLAGQMTLDWVPCWMLGKGGADDVAIARQQGINVFDVSGQTPSPALVEALAGSGVRLPAGDPHALEWASAAGTIRVCLTSVSAGALDDLRDMRQTQPPGALMFEVDSGDLRDDDALWEALLTDEIDLIARADGLALLPFLYGEGVERRGLSMPRLVQLLAANPAAFYGVATEKGSLVPGSDGDLFVFDPGPAEERAGVCLRGRVVFALLRGDILLFNNELHVFPGHGRMLQTAGR